MLLSLLWSIRVCISSHEPGVSVVGAEGVPVDAQGADVGRVGHLRLADVGDQGADRGKQEPIGQKSRVGAEALLGEFVRAGGTVIAFGALPANSETEFPSSEVKALSHEIFNANAKPAGKINAWLD